MKIVIINFLGDVEKTTIARHPLAPRIKGVELKSHSGIDLKKFMQLPQPSENESVSPSEKVTGEWLKKGILNMKRMHSDEAYRLEIASKLS